MQFIILPFACCFSGSCACGGGGACSGGGGGGACSGGGGSGACSGFFRMLFSRQAEEVVHCLAQVSLLYLIRGRLLHQILRYLP